jgi:prepilin-type N-terminal cleavage/methylation domain-containing protein
MTRLPLPATDLHSLDAGFTLLELLVALSLLLMIATVTAPRYLIHGSSTQLRTFTTSVVASLKNARDDAIRSHANITVSFQLKAMGSLHHPHDRMIQIPTGLKVDISTLPSCGNTTKDAQLQFKRDGSSCDTTVLISAQSGTRTIHVNGLTGGITNE